VFYIHQLCLARETIAYFMGYMLSNLEYHDMQSNFQCYTAIYLFQHPQAGTSTKLMGLYCIGLPNTCAALINSPAKHVPANAIRHQPAIAIKMQISH